MDVVGMYVEVGWSNKKKSNQSCFCELPCFGVNHFLDSSGSLLKIKFGVFKMSN